MEKLTALLLAGVLAGSAFTGCGKQSNDSSKPESSAAEESSVKETEAAAENHRSDYHYRTRKPYRDGFVYAGYGTDGYQRHAGQGQRHRQQL